MEGWNPLKFAGNAWASFRINLQARILVRHGLEASAGSGRMGG